MAVKHVGASKAPGLMPAHPRRSVNIAAARPAQKVTVAPGEIKVTTDSELAVARALLTEAPPVEAASPQESPALAAPADPQALIAAATESAPPDAPRPAVPAPAPHAPAVDYYAIISRTIDGLVLNNAETRADIYERAGAVVAQRLKEADPPLPSHLVAVEQIAVERAISRIEAEQLAKPPAPPKPPEPAVAPTAESSVTPGAAAATPAATEIAIQNPAPAVLTGQRQKFNALVGQAHGGTLRLFAVIVVVIAGLFGYWLATGKPNFIVLRTPATSPPALQSAPAAEKISSAPAPASGEGNAAATVADAPKPVADVSDASREPPISTDTGERSGISATSIIDLANFLALCSPLQAGNSTCDNLQPRPLGASGASLDDTTGWPAPYASLAQALAAPSVAKPAFSNAPSAPAQAVAAAKAAESARTNNNAARERFERAVTSAKNDNIDGAIADFSEAIRLDPKFTDAYVQRGQVLFKNGNPERAIDDFSKALTIDPRNALAYKARGMAMLYKGDDDSAIIDLTKAIQYAELDAKLIPEVEVFYARRSRANLYDRKQLYDRELLDLSAMIDGYWRNPALAAALKTTYRDQGVATLMASIYRSRALVHQKRSSLDAAIGDLSFAIQLDPSRTLQFLIERARLLETAGRKDAAMADYQQALDLSPANTDVRNALARLRGRT